MIFSNAVIDMYLDKIVLSKRTVNHRDNNPPLWFTVRLQLSSGTRSQIEKGNVKVIDAVYDLRTGAVEWLPEQQGKSNLDETSTVPTQVSDAAPKEK